MSIAKNAIDMSKIMVCRTYRAQKKARAINTVGAVALLKPAYDAAISPR